MRWRIGLGFAGLAAVLFGAVGWVSGQQARSQAQEDAARVLAQLAARVMSDLDVGMFERRREVRNLAEPVDDPAIDADRWRLKLQRLQASNTYYSWIGLVDLQGRVLAATGGLLEGQDVSARPWFRGARGQTFVGDVHDALMLARLLPPGRQWRAPAPGRFRHAGPGRWPAGGRPGRAPELALGRRASAPGADRCAADAGIEILVLDAQGRVLLGPPQPAPPAASVLAAADAGLVAWGDGQRYLSAAVRSSGHQDYPGLGWSVLVRQPAAQALQRAVTLERRIWAVGAAGAVLFGVLGWWLAGGLTAALRAAARQARGLLDDPADPSPLPTGDEVALLTGSLQRLQQRAAVLHDSNAELQDFSRNVSHDLRGPIGSIGLLLRQVLDNPNEPLGERARRSLGVVVKECERLVQLVEELLTLAMVDQRELQHGAVDMQDLVNQVVEQVAPGGSGPQFVVGELPAVDGDSLLLQQVWHNLIANAVKFSGRVARPRIVIDATAGPAGTTYRVRDNGAGFDMAQAGRLFKVFQRLHLASDFQGTGVGLSIVHRVVRRHGGKVWAESSPGAGACFFFTLPGVAAPAEAARRT